MRKSKLQQEFDKQLRLLERQIKKLQDTGATFNPPKIEDYKRKTRITKDDVDRIKFIRSDLEKINAKKKAIEQPSKGRKKGQEYIPHPRTKKEKEYTPHPRKKLSEEEKKARRNFRARVRRLEKQGFDTSLLKKGNQYNLEELKELKGRKLSEQAFKDGKSAYEIRKEKATAKRKDTIAFRERVKQGFYEEPKSQTEYIKKRELGDYVDIGRGSLADHYKDDLIIQTIMHYFDQIPDRNNKYVLTGVKRESLKALLEDIVNSFETDEELKAYEDYLRANESTITSLLIPFYEDSDDFIEQSYAELLTLLNQGALAPEQSTMISDIGEQNFYDSNR